MLLGHGTHHVVAAGIAEPDQLVGHFFARLLGKPLGVGQLIGADEPFADQNFGVIAAGDLAWLARWSMVANAQMVLK